MEDIKTIIKCAKRENFYFKREKEAKKGRFFIKEDASVEKEDASMEKEDKLHKKEDIY